MNKTNELPSNVPYIALGDTPRNDRVVSGQFDGGHIISAEAANDIANGKGTKDDKGKPDLTLLDPYFDEETAYVMMDGAKKYKRGNWQLDLEILRLLAAAERHLNELKKGIWLDKESGRSHCAHLRCNMQFLEFYRRHGKEIPTEHNKG